MSAQEKTLRRVNALVARGEFYEAHQAVRTVVARHARARDTAAATSLLYSSALVLARAGASGSAGDLLLYLLRLDTDSKIKADNAAKGRVASIAWQLDPADSVVRQAAQHSLAWAPHDADLSHVFGTVLLRAGKIVEAEKLLLQGTKDSAELLAAVHFRWAQTAPGAEQGHLLYSRGVMGYLSAGNVRLARIYWENLITGHGLEPTASKITELLALLVPTCQTRNEKLYRQLVNQYRPLQLVPAWKPALDRIELLFFDIRPQKQFNIMDLMGGMMK